MSNAELPAEAVVAAEWIVTQMTLHNSRIPPGVKLDFTSALSQAIAQRLNATGEVALISHSKEFSTWLGVVTSTFGLGTSYRLLPEHTLMRVRPSEIWVSVGFRATASRLL